LRVAATEGGCGGLTYDAAIDREMQKGESVVLQSGDIRILSDPESSQYLESLTIDYSDYYWRRPAIYQCKCRNHLWLRCTFQPGRLPAYRKWHVRERLKGMQMTDAEERMEKKRTVRSMKSHVSVFDLALLKRFV